MKKLQYIDLFCGAGGTSTGVERAFLDGTKCASVIACVNHDAHAIASHAANHPKAVHYTEDIRKKIADPRWYDERRELRTCEQLYSEFIYRLSKLT